MRARLSRVPRLFSDGFRRYYNARRRPTFKCIRIRNPSQRGFYFIFIVILWSASAVRPHAHSAHTAPRPYKRVAWRYNGDASVQPTGRVQTQGTNVSVRRFRCGPHGDGVFRAVFRVGKKVAAGRTKNTVGGVVSRARQNDKRPYRVR